MINREFYGHRDVYRHVVEIKTGPYLCVVNASGDEHRAILLRFYIYQSISASLEVRVVEDPTLGSRR